MERIFLEFNKDETPKSTDNGSNSSGSNPTATPANERGYIEKGAKPDSIYFPRKNKS